MKQLTGRIHGLRRVCFKASFKTKLKVANGVVMIKLTYRITLWGGTQQYLPSALQVQQMTAARAVCGFRENTFQHPVVGGELLGVAGGGQLLQLHGQYLQVVVGGGSWSTCLAIVASTATLAWLRTHDIILSLGIV